MDYRQNRDQNDQGYQSGWNQQGRQRNQWQDQPDYESDTFINRNPSQQPSYGEVYHGNLKQREEETNRARGRGYGNMNQGSNMNQGWGQRGRQDYNPGGYGQVGNTGGGHGAWDSYGSGSYDIGGNYEGYGNQYGQGGGGNWERRSGGNYGQNYRNSGMQQYSSGGNYGREHRRDDDRDSWWERAKDKVSSWFSDDDDDNRRRYGGDYNRGNMQRAGSDYRTSGEHRGKGPKGYQRSEERIREDVCERLYEDGFVDASDIEVKVEGSEVILSGTVRSREEKRRAEDLVESISGVRNVENRLRVNQESGSWMNAGSHRDEHNRPSDYSRYGSSGYTGSSSGSSLENRSYTGNSGDGTGIGNESGTTNEIIRNSGNLDTNR